MTTQGELGSGTRSATSRSVGVLVAVVLVVLALLTVFWSSWKSPRAAANGGAIERQPSDGLKPVAPVLQVLANPSNATKEPTPHITWSQVPASIALFSPFRGVFGGSAAPPNWFMPAIISRLDQMFGGDPQRTDLELRAVGLTQSIDHVICQAMGLTVERVIHAPAEYFPRGMGNAPELPANMKQKEVEERLLAVWKSRTDLVTAVPDKFADAGADAAFEPRLLVMASGLLSNPEILEIVLTSYAQAKDPIVKAAAASALLQSPSHYQEVLNYLEGAKEPAEIERAAAILESNVVLQGYIVVSGDRQLRVYQTLAKSTREMDNWLLNQLQTATPNAQRPALIRAMASRTDNPAIAALLLNTLSTTDDPMLAAEILRARPTLQCEPGYARSLERWIRSDSSYAGLWATRVAGSSLMPDARGLVADLLNKADARFVNQGLHLLISDPDLAAGFDRQLLTEVMTKWSNDPGVRDSANTILNGKRMSLFKKRLTPEEAQRQGLKILVQN